MVFAYVKGQERFLEGEKGDTFWEGETGREGKAERPSGAVKRNKWKGERLQERLNEVTIFRQCECADSPLNRSVDKS
jgi:hypothetical protein